MDSRECWRRQFPGCQIEPIAQVKLGSREVHEYNAFTAAGTCAVQITRVICSAMMFVGMVLVKNEKRWKHNGAIYIISESLNSCKQPPQAADLTPLGI